MDFLSHSLVMSQHCFCITVYVCDDCYLILQLLKECIINSELDVVKAIATRGLRLSRDATEMEAAVDEVLKESRDLVRFIVSLHL